MYGLNKLQGKTKIENCLHFDRGIVACNIHAKDSYWFWLKKFPKMLLFFSLKPPQEIFFSPWICMLTNGDIQKLDLPMRKKKINTINFFFKNKSFLLLILYKSIIICVDAQFRMLRVLIWHVNYHMTLHLHNSIYVTMCVRLVGMFGLGVGPTLVDA